MKELIVTYFAAERRDGMLALIAGLAALSASAWLVITRHQHRGAAIPLALIAVIELAVAASYLSRDVTVVLRLLEQLDTSPQALAATELPRMNTTVRNYRLTVVAEVIVLVAGVALALAGRRDFWFAVGLGCIIQAAPLLIADVLGARRASVYHEALQALQPAALEPRAPPDSGAPNGSARDERVTGVVAGREVVSRGGARAPLQDSNRHG